MKLRFLILIIFAGCATGQYLADQRLAHLKEVLNPQCGTSDRETMTRQFGLPDRREDIGDSEFWYYHKSYGYRSTGTYSYYLSMSSDWEAYDDLTFEFRDGILRTWKAYVQR